MDIKEKKIIDCDLSVRAICTCRIIGAETLGELAKMNRNDVMRSHNVSTKTLYELDDLLTDNGLNWSAT